MLELGLTTFKNGLIVYDFLLPIYIATIDRLLRRISFIVLNYYHRFASVISCTMPANIFSRLETFIILEFRKYNC